MPVHLTAEQRQLAVTLKARGLSLREIGPQVGCSHQGVAPIAGCSPRRPGSVSPTAPRTTLGYMTPSESSPSSLRTG